MERRTIRIPWFLILMAVVLALTFLIPQGNAAKRLSSADMEELIRDPSKVTNVNVTTSTSNNTANVTVSYLNGDVAKATVADAADFAEKLTAAGITYTMLPGSDGGFWKYLPYVVLIIFLLFFFLSPQHSLKFSRKFSFSSSPPPT